LPGFGIACRPSRRQTSQQGCERPRLANRRDVTGLRDDQDAGLLTCTVSIRRGENRRQPNERLDGIVAIRSIDA
jgi:hypothetical protein